MSFSQAQEVRAAVIKYYADNPNVFRCVQLTELIADKLIPIVSFALICAGAAGTLPSPTWGYVTISLSAGINILSLTTLMPIGLAVGYKGQSAKEKAKFVCRTLAINFLLLSVTLIPCALTIPGIVPVRPLCYAFLLSPLVVIPVKKCIIPYCLNRYVERQQARQAQAGSPPVQETPAAGQVEDPDGNV